MTGTFEVLNGDTKVSFEFTADTTKVQTVIGDAAHWLWGGTEEDWALLSNQDKLDLVDKHIKDQVIKIATVYLRSAGEAEAREAAEQTALDDYDLGV